MAGGIIGFSLPRSIGVRSFASRRIQRHPEAMDNWRERLHAALKAKGHNMKSASLSADLNPAAVQQIVKGKDPQASTLQKLASKHGLSLDEILLGRPAADAQPQTADVRLARVAGTVAAGLWFSADAPPQVESEPVPYVPCRYPDLEQTAYKVSGPSMNRRRIEDGDYVITVPYWQARVGVQDADIVVVQRHRDGDLVELTVKEIVVRLTEIHLMPRSTDPQFQEPIVIPRDPNADGYDSVEIVGLVVGRYSPL